MVAVEDLSSLTLVTSSGCKECARDVRTKASNYIHKLYFSSYLCISKFVLQFSSVLMSQADKPTRDSNVIPRSKELISANRTTRRIGIFPTYYYEWHDAGSAGSSKTPRRQGLRRLGAISI